MQSESEDHMIQPKEDLRTFTQATEPHHLSWSLTEGPVYPKVIGDHLFKEMMTISKSQQENTERQSTRSSFEHQYPAVPIVHPDPHIFHFIWF